MASFVLIHGAFHTGACFDLVAAQLRARGHAVLAPTLPGMGGDEAALRAASLEGWARFALNACHALCSESGGPVVLAGHSRGGSVISLAAEIDPAAADHLAYICAVLTPAGEDRAKLPGLMPSQPGMQAASAMVENGAGIVMDGAAALPYFAQLCPEDLREDAISHLVAEPLGPLSTPAEVTAQRWGSVPRTYIECLQDRTMPIENQRGMLALSPGTRVVTLDSDHSPFYCVPGPLADALEALAG
ncbi:alpha/beta fold hydrolase [Novosphingobium mangrovi (ex Huang et al. 2023)]|uniref:Alpha/beta hydrolase n=1 Tax=Novosphingobium mangrovi (ex Huang et al. 2023) TaxID=2976432 RepID=A0ABT2I8H8_9SPHN|nr:alpha/beta hydrolase [Novosphingobium mangrovi (ex Huang et al. 2023)]MCT2401118.1 alpha/beta hydrolase [Novosphingobium mangrovi (ex Huang et al. 2023)]